MRIEYSASLLGRIALALAILILPVHATAGVHVQRFGYFENEPGGSTSFTDDFNAGGPFVNPTGAFLWNLRVGTVAPQEDTDLHFRPWMHGSDIAIGPYTVRAQVMELQTPLTGLGAIDDTPNHNFFVFGVYRLGTYGREDTVAGIALTDVFRGAGTRAIVTNVGWEGGRTYGKFSNALTGEVSDKRFFDIPDDAALLELFMFRETPTSDSVVSGYAFRKLDFSLIGTVNFFSGKQVAFSDVVLSPVLFAAVPVPEPETWVLLLAGLAVVAHRASKRIQRFPPARA